jgi:hypothetical protein
MANFVFTFPTLNWLRCRAGICCLILCLCLQGCAEDKSELIAAKVLERVEDFRKKRIEACRQSLLAKAESAVDSLLLAEAQESLQDSLARLKPFRPVQPPAVLPIDSLKIKPIFDKDSNQ